VADVPEYSQLSPRKESETSKILAGATFHGRIAVTGARYDRRISRGRSYIRRTYAERKFLEQALSYHARGLQGADRDHAQTLCEIEKPEKFFRSRVGLPVNGRPADADPRFLEGRKIELADKSSREGMSGENQQDRHLQDSFFFWRSCAIFAFLVFSRTLLPEIQNQREY